MSNNVRLLVSFIMALSAMTIITVSPPQANADHLSRQQCYQYFDCLMGTESTLNRCYDNEYIKKNAPTRTICMKYAQHECKVKAGIQGTGKKMTISRPLDKYNRPHLLDHEAGVEALVDEDIRIYNYAGWNHCPPQYQGLQDFWCDPEQLRYPPRPWCDVIPTYNIQDPYK